MDAVREDVKKLVEKELKSANEKFPLFHSDHEGAAVIFEELQETEEALLASKKLFSELWNSVKNNEENRHLYIATSIYHRSISLACEAIQVAAMAQKFVDSNKGRNEK